MYRKHFLFTIGVILMSMLSSSVLNAASRADIEVLLPPERTGGIPLMEALDRRQSIREYRDKALPPQVLSNLLWAAWGYNRQDEKKRTAPSSMNRQEMSVYLAMKKGLYLYDAETHGLVMIKDADIREVTGKQDFAGTAPLNLIFVADTRKQSSLTASYANTGFMSQNVYLYCASAGLGGVVRGWFDEDALHEAMGLEDHQKIILCHTVGYPAE